MIRHVGVYFHKTVYHPKADTIRTIAEYDKALYGHEEVGYNFYADHFILFHAGAPNLDCEILFDDPFFLPNLVDRYKEHIEVGNVIGDIAIRDMIIQEIENELIAQCPIIGQGGQYE
jgi:hypothetical protein